MMLLRLPISSGWNVNPMNRNHVLLVWPVRQPVVVEEARSQLAAGTVIESAHAQEDVVEVIW